MSTHKQLMIPGPVEFHEDVLAAAGGLAQSHVDPEFIGQFGETIEMLRKVFVTEKGQPFVVSGSGTLGWDMVAANLVEAGEAVLVLNTGYFGDRFGECLETYGAAVTHVRAPKVGDRPSLADIEAALDAAPAGGYKLVTITHVDTSTGVLMDVQLIAELVARKAPNTLVIVDGVCSVGGEDLQVDAWKLGAVLTGSQKALGTPPGLSIVVVGEAAMKVFEARKTPVPNYYASWKRWAPIMRAYEERRPSYFATPAVQLVQSLRVSLQLILQQTPDVRERFARHAAVSEEVKNEIESWGLSLVPVSRDKAAHTMTAVYLPEGMAPTQLLPLIARRGVMVAGGLHADIAPRYFRIGHMGISVMEGGRGHIANVLRVLKEALVEAGHKFPKSEL